MGKLRFPAYMELSEDGSRIELRTEYRANDLAKAIHGSRWSARERIWRLPCTWNACVQARAEFGEGLEVGPGLLGWSNARYLERELLLHHRDVALDPANDTAGHSELRPYQRTAVQYLRTAGRAILGDEQGCGKTVELAVTLAEEAAWPALIVAPRGMQLSWQADLNRWAPGRDHVVLSGTATARRKQLDAYLASEQPGALVVTYHHLPIHSRLAGYGSVRLTDKEKAPKELNGIPWQAVVADEAHRAIHPKTKWTRALWWLADNAPRAFMLTGTVTSNDVSDFWSLLRAVAPDEWPSRSKYLDSYCTVSVNFFGGTEVTGLKPDREAEFHALVAPRFLRRTKAVVLPYLPEKVWQTRQIDLPPKLRRAYNQMAKGGVSEVDGRRVEAFDALTRWQRLSQFASASMEECGEHEVELPDGTTEMRADYRMVEPSPKVDELVDLLEDLGPTPVAVFAASRQLLDLAAARLEKLDRAFSMCAGGMHPYEMNEAKDRFNSGEVDLILISLGAGAEGLSLTRGSTEVFLDRSWRELANAQAEDRMHGIGRGDQTAESLLIIDIVAADTVEQRRAEALTDKREQRQQITRDDELIEHVFGKGGK